MNIDDAAKIIFNRTLYRLGEIVSPIDYGSRLALLNTLSSMANVPNGDRIENHINTIRAYYHDHIDDFISFETIQKKDSKEVINRISNAPKIMVLMSHIIKDTESAVEGSLEYPENVIYSIASLLSLLHKDLFLLFNKLESERVKVLVTYLKLGSDYHWKKAKQFAVVNLDNDKSDFVNELDKARLYFTALLAEKPAPFINNFLESYDSLFKNMNVHNSSKKSTEIFKSGMILSDLMGTGLDVYRALDLLSSNIRKQLLPVALEKGYLQNEDIHQAVSNALLASQPTRWLDYAKRWHQNFWITTDDDGKKVIFEGKKEFRKFLHEQIKSQIKDMYGYQVSTQTVERIEKRILDVALIISRPEPVSFSPSSHSLHLWFDIHIIQDIIKKLLVQYVITKESYLLRSKKICQLIHQNPDIFIPHLIAFCSGINNYLRIISERLPLFEDSHAPKKLPSIYLQHKMLRAIEAETLLANMQDNYNIISTFIYTKQPSNISTNQLKLTVRELADDLDLLHGRVEGNGF